MYNIKEIENEVLNFWQKNNIYEKLVEKNKKGKSKYVLDGPPYANFIPHVGHIKNSVFKDMIIRIAFMKGNNVLFQPGFDTHGLPVENMVEKILGLQNKKDIESYGAGKFMEECKKNAALNKDLWMSVYKNLGSLYSNKEPYITYENYYVNSAWWAFAQMYKKGLVYHGERPVMWCPHCETSLAGYEVTDSYKEVSDPGVYVLFKLKNSDENLLVYTTTPWTLPANVAIAVAPKEDYVLIELGKRKIILAEKRLEKLSEIGREYKILKKFNGDKLVGKKYEPLLDVPLQRSLEAGERGKAHEIIASISILKERVASKMRTKKGVSGSDLFEEFVTVNEGTGLVHVAPGHGKTDYMIGTHYKLAAVSPVDDKCYLTEESGFSGFVKKADDEIIKYLENEGKLLYKDKIKHNYPLCWRCKSPLIFRLSNQLFFKVDKVKKVIEKVNKKVKWHPEFARERFDNWVANAEDWNISRQRYWGTPIPIWICGNKEIVIDSAEELEKLSGKKIKDLHNVDNVLIKKDGKEYKKIKGILDVWFDSGVAPWASLGYPAENKKLFESNFPVSRINEAQDQIRGWFYSLMFCSAAIFEKPAYKEVSMTGWVLDKSGNKMSKSVGNVVTAEEALRDLGADVLRYYFCWDVAPYDTQKFNADIAKKEIGKILNVLWNLKNLSSVEKVKAGDIEDKWILSKLESMTKKYSEYIDNFEYQQAFREISDFVLNTLSRDYVQMTREKENEAIVTLCLVKTLTLLAPAIPFVTDKIWQELKDKKIVKEESVHLSSWPKYDKKKINEKIEKDFEIVMKIIEVGLSERDKAGIGLRWPLASAEIHSEFVSGKELEEIIKRQLNVKKVVTKKNKDIIVKLDTTLTEELEAEGYAREFARKIQAERKNAGLKKGQLIALKVNISGKLKDMLQKYLSFILERTNSKEIKFTDGKIGEKSLEFKIKEEKISVKFS